MRSYRCRILRYVHDVSKGEFVNIGVVMWIPEHSRLIFRLNEQYRRISGFFKNFDGISYRQMLRNLQRSFKKVASDLQKPPLTRDTPKNTLEVFNLLVRENASTFQWSQVISGISTNPEDRLDRLFEECVTFHESLGRRRSPQPRNERMIWKTVHQAVKAHHLEDHVRLNFPMKSASFEHSFKMGWNNGIRQVLEPISLGLRKPVEIIDRANIWSGRLFNLSKGNDFGCTAVLAPRDEHVDMTAFNHGLQILKDAPSMRGVIIENEVNDYMSEIKKDLAIENLDIFSNS
jgi:hypothetical protein